MRHDKSDKNRSISGDASSMLSSLAKSGWANVTAPIIYFLWHLAIPLKGFGHFQYISERRKELSKECLAWWVRG